MIQNANILIIEDKAEDSVFLDELVKSLGYKPWLASSGSEAVKLFGGVKFAAVLSELFLKDISATDLTSEILKASPSSNVILMTTPGFIASAVEVMQQGAYGYVIKPFIPAEIKIALAHTVEKFSLISSEQDKVHYAKMAVIDGLTQIYNHRYFEVFLEAKFKDSRRRNDTFSLLMIDLDDFKKYNDTYGHPAGDELLRNAADIFKTSVREEDVVFRYGGEEFSIFLAHSDKKDAALASERIRIAFTLYLPVTISVGVANFPVDSRDTEGLVGRADEALYKAKTTGKNKICIA